MSPGQRAPDSSMVRGPSLQDQEPVHSPGPLFSGEPLFCGLCSPALLPQEQEGGQE